jgi:peroxiredoxin
MMMKKIFALFAVSALLFSCTDRGRNIVIRGKLTNPKGEYVYLQELTVTNDGIIDSFLLEKSGSFKFKRKVDNPSFYTLWVGKVSKNITLLAMPGERIKIKGQADSLFYTYDVTGSDESGNVRLLTRRLDKTIRCVDSLNRVLQQFNNNPNLQNIYNVLKMNYDRCLEEQRMFTISFLKKNPTSLACLLAIYQKINSSTFVLGEENDLVYMKQVDSAMYMKYKEVPYIKQLHANIEVMLEQKNRLQIQRMLSVMGAKAPEIALPSVKGDTIRLSSTKSKVVLLYFWASWNKESRLGHPDMVTLYNMYRSKGFEIFEVSLDKNKEDWINAIRADGLWWIQACDLKYWQSPVVKLYNFEKLPTSFLIDKDGVIISRDVKGDALKDKLAEIFGEKSTNTASK